jgi:hypothetical protein
LASGLPALQGTALPAPALPARAFQQTAQFAENLKNNSAMKEDYLEITKNFSTPWRGSRSEPVTRIYVV